MQKLSKGIATAAAAAIAVSSGMRRSPIRFWDIGARWGLSRSMEALYRVGVVRPMFFDPEAAEASRLTNTYKNCKVFNCALWDHDGNATLYVTHEPGESSLLKPIDPGYIASTEIVPTKRADTLLNGSAADLYPEIVKLDVQGAEVAVLEGFGALLDRVTCIEAEVSFQRLYEDQPLVERVTEFLMNRGFGLFALRMFGVRSTRASIHANAFFVRSKTETDRERTIEYVFRTINRISLAP